ncbi:unnamed protein product, partial [Clonostachys rosea f. rosea IK726]
MPASATLTSEQRHALFDILSHSETYSEIENFKYPDGVTGYGFPFSSETVIPPPPVRSASTTPAGSGRNTLGHGPGPLCLLEKRRNLRRLERGPMAR